MDAFYNNEPAPRADPAQERKLGEIWEQYKGEQRIRPCIKKFLGPLTIERIIADPSDPKLIKIDGTMELCEELDIDPGTVSCTD